MRVLKKTAAITMLMSLVLGMSLTGCLGQGSKDDETDKKPEKQIESNIPMEENRVVTCRNIDSQLSAELNTGEYTFENPMIVQNPYQNAPLTALVLFNTEEEVSVKVTVKGNTEALDFSGETAVGTSHRVPVLGLYAGRTNEVLLELLDQDGTVVENKMIEIATDPLPETMEDKVDVSKSGADTAMPMIMVTGQRNYHSFAFDKEGEIRWYLSDVSGSYGIFPVSGGKFMLQDKETLVPTAEKPHTTNMYEMDYMGRVHRIYYLENGWHHEVIEKEPGGNLLVLSNSIDGHVEDMVVELDRKTGKVVKKLDMREIFGDTYVDMVDWAHLNTIDYDPEENTVILSPRNVHSVIKVDWETNELRWILSDPRFWEGTEFEDKVLKPEGDIVWHYQQHSTYQIPDMDDDPDTMQLMLFDNHWDKTRKVDFYDGDPNSYVTQYTINEADHTVRQDKLFGGVKSKITSNFVLKKDENRLFSMGGCLDPVIDDYYNGMIYEFTYDTEEVVNQYALRDTFYRAYGFEPDYKVLEKEMNHDEPWDLGDLKAWEKTELPEETPQEKTEEELPMKIVDEILYIKANDHTISNLYLDGEKQDYRISYESAFPGEEKYVNVSYNIAVPLNKIKEDSYTLLIDYKGELCNTGKQITIK